MYTATDLLKYTQHLSALYVEDDDELREETSFLLEPFYKLIDVASDGYEALEMYNNKQYDIVITDISMPRIDGIELILKIKEINPEQKIVAVSAHNESEILMNLAKTGVNSFILKPILLHEVINALLPVCRDAYMQVLNIQLVNELNEKNEELLKQIKMLKTKTNIIDTKHAQIEKLLKLKSSKTDEAKKILPDYFAKDEDEGVENVTFLKDDADDLLEYFQEVSDRLTFAINNSNPSEVKEIAAIFSKTGSILFRYTPYLDSLAKSMNELSAAIEEHTDEFMEVLMSDNDGIFGLFDAVSSDMDRYVERFSVESIAMKNSHHIHEPTTLSIRQIITLFVANEDEGEIEFF